MRTVTVFYKCKCMKEEVSVEVEERGFQEDIEEFMHRLVWTLAGDHTRRSPLCRATKMEYAKVPVTDKGVGTETAGNA